MEHRNEQHSFERNGFRSYTTALIKDVQIHPDSDNIEIEAVFMKWSAHIVLNVIRPGNQPDVVIDCGTPIVEHVSDTEKLLIPQPLGGKHTLPRDYQHWADGIRVYVHADIPQQKCLPYIRDIYKPVNKHVPKVFTVVRNQPVEDDVNGSHVYHLFPNATHNVELVNHLCQAYADLGHRSEQTVPNYMLRAVRNRNYDPKDAPADAYREVVETLVQKSRDLEKELETDRLLVHSFDASRFKKVYKRFKFLASEPTSGMVSLGSHMTVDVADIRTADDYNNNTNSNNEGDESRSSATNTTHKTTRLTLNGQSAFDRFCRQFKSLKSPSEISEYVSQQLDSECELMHKSEMTEEDLKILSSEQFTARDRFYNGFKLNVKREQPMDKTTSIDELRRFFDSKRKHTYRFKNRQSFRYNGYRIDLTQVQRADDDHRTFKPTPFVALQKLQQQTGHSETYELEIERDMNTDIETMMSAEKEAETLLYLLDNCMHAVHNHMEYYGNHINLDRYPTLLDTRDMLRVTNAFNQQPCHPMRVHDFPTGSFRVKDKVSPSVINMTHATHQYVCHHWDDYRLFVKTDGVHCLGFVEADQSLLHLYVNKAMSWMTFPLSKCPSEDFVVDGEFYFKGAGSNGGKCSFFIFDVYSKGNTCLFTEPLVSRLASFDADSIEVSQQNVVVRKKLPLTLTEYQSTTDTKHLPEFLRRQLENFECRDARGVRPQDDGFIVMHAGPLVCANIVSDEEETEFIQSHGAKPYIMRLDEFERRGKGLAERSQHADPYVMCLKWKPQDECTIDFQLQFVSDVYDPVVEGRTRRVKLCSKYNNQRSTVNVYTVLKTLSSGKEDHYAPMVPRKKQLPRKSGSSSQSSSNNGSTSANYPFQPSDVYDYELGIKPVAPGIQLPCDPVTGSIKTEAGEQITHNAIVEMQYTPSSQTWLPMRLRTDKTEPNAYNVALANWQNIFHPVSPPRSWNRGNPESFDTTVLRAYYGDRGGGGKTCLVDRIHQLLKQYLIFVSAKAYANEDPRKLLKVFEMGCGRGTDLWHWNYVHENIRPIQFYLGTDYDVHWLVCADGAIENYLQGGNGKNAACTLDTKYDFDAVYAQADSGAPLSVCARQPWSKQPISDKPVSSYKLHYQLLRHVLFGHTPEEPALAEALSHRLVHPTYSLVSSQMAMHHFSQPHGAFWDNLELVLATDGLFVATVPNGDFIREQLEASDDGSYRVCVNATELSSTRRRVNSRQRRGGGRNDNKSSNDVVQTEMEWYVYEQVLTPITESNKHWHQENGRLTHVRFHTPKINPSIEPLFFRNSLKTSSITKRFEVVYLDTFGAFADEHGMSIYDAVCDPFHTDSIRPETLQHDPHCTNARNVQRVQDTPAAQKYSRNGHYVVVLAKRGRSRGEMERLRRFIGGVNRS